MAKREAGYAYRELEPLAEGGMAVLSKGERDDGLVVVIKRIRPPFDSDAGYRRLFHDEGRILAALRHDNVVRLLDAGEDELGPYLVFEHVEGTDLGVVLERRIEEKRPLDVATVLALALELFDALAFIHEASDEAGAPLGVVHRDVSPGNVLLSVQGDVKLADFGVASSALKTEATVAGELKGKFAYMAPEQTRGERVDARADLFAAGVVLWECLAAERLFDGPTDADVVCAVREAKAPPLEEKNPEVPLALAALVARLLEKELELRPASAREVQAALREIAAELCVEQGRRQRIAHLARSHPRPRPNEHPHVQELRRRTQRLLGAGGFGGKASRRAALSRRAAVSGAGVALLVAVAWGGATRFAPGAEGLAPGAAGIAPNAERRAPSAKGLAPGAAGLAQGSRFEAPGSRPEAQGSQLEAPGSRPEAQGSQLEAPGSRPEAQGSQREKKDAHRGFGTLSLESDPWASVSVNGAPLGLETPLLGLRLPAGEHRIRLENPVFGISREIRISIRPGEETRRFVDLTQRR